MEFSILSSHIQKQRGNERSAEFYGLEEKSDDLSKLEHLTVDYEGDLDKQLDSLQFDAGLSCIGVYTADVKNEKDFFKKEHEPNIKIAKAAALHGAKRWSYLSGMGVKQTTEKKWNQALFSWVKGRVEADLQMIDGFECVSSMRPGWIAGRPRSNNMGKMASLGADIGEYLGPHLIKTKLAVHRDDISTAMVHSILDDSCKESMLICENEDIKEQAQKYRQYLSSNYSTKSPM